MQPDVDLSLTSNQGKNKLINEETKIGFLKIFNERNIVVDILEI